MKTFQTLALIAALATGAFTAPAFAIPTCTKNCDLPDHNGPSIDGFAAASLSAASPNSIEMYSAPSGPSCAVRNTCDLMDPTQLDADFGDDSQSGQQQPQADRS